MVVLVNILKSGRCSSLGGGGLGGGLAFLFGIGESGNKMSFNEYRDEERELGVDMLACMDVRGSLTM